MLKKSKQLLYNISRTTGHCASVLTDVTTLMSGDMKKIKRRLKRKAAYNLSSKLIRKIK